MKKILLSLMAVVCALSMSAAIDLTDPSTYTVKVLDFKNDNALAGQNFTLGSSVGTAWETGNAKYQTIYNCTAPSALDGLLALQAHANGGGRAKGYWLRSGYGLVMINATRSGAVTNLVAGQIVVFQLSGNFAIDATGSGKNEGTYTRTVSEDGKTLTYTMTGDGNLGFCISARSTTNAIQSISIYKEKKAGECTAPEAKVTGTNGTARVITLTDADESAKIYWSETKEGEYAEYTAPVTTSAEKIYIYADNGSKSEVVEFETGAGTLVKLNGVTVTRTGDNTFTVTSSQADVVGTPTATIVYTINGGAEQTAASGATITVDGNIKAWAAVEGYTSSDATEVAFVAPYEKADKLYEADFITLGADKADFTPASEETRNFDEVEGDYYYSSLNDIYLQVAQSGDNYTWLYRSGKGNSNFKCQYADAYMVFENVKAGTVIDIYAGNDNATKNPIKDVVNGENGYSYGGHYFFKADANGNLAIMFSTGSMIMSVTEYAAPAAPVNTVEAGKYIAQVTIAEAEGVAVPAEFQAYVGTHKYGMDLAGDEKKLTISGMSIMNNMEIVGDAVAYDATKTFTMNGKEFTICSVDGTKTEGELAVTKNEDGSISIEDFGFMKGGVFAGTAKNITAYVPEYVEAEANITFEDIDLQGKTYYDGSDGYGLIATAEKFSFMNYNPGGYWYGFGVSATRSDIYTGNYKDDSQFNSVVAGGMQSEKFAVCYYNEYQANNYDEYPEIYAEDNIKPEYAYITNTAYTVKSMTEGDTFSKKFDETDWLKLTIIGLDDEDKETGEPVEFYLAKDGNIVTEWTKVDLTSLGVCSHIRFTMSCSQTSGGYMNTPAYFALDNMKAAITDEPTTAVKGVANVQKAAQKVQKLMKNGQILIKTANGIVNAAGAQVK